MKRFSIGILLLLIAAAVIGCGNTAQDADMAEQPVQGRSELKILTNVNKYSPLMSSVQGISMTPEFKTTLNDPKVEYHWTASSGDFLLVEDKRVKEIVNSGEEVLWVPEFEENADNSIIITLQAKDASTGTMLSETALEIEQDGIFYIVKS